MQKNSMLSLSQSAGKRFSMFDLVILNYKNYLDTIELLDSIFKSNEIDSLANIYIIDNDSQNDSLTHIKNSLGLDCESKGVNIIKDFENKITTYEKFNLEHVTLHFVQSKNNGGYAAGNNIGIELFLSGSSSFVLVCNNDIVFPCHQLDTFIEESVNLMTKDSSLGLVSNVLYYYSDKEKIQASGGYLNQWICRTSHQNSNNSTLIDTNKPDYPIGALLFFKRSTIEDVGLLSESYFLYFEELDYCYRMKKNNLDFAVLSKSKVLHKEGASVGSNTNDYKAVSLVSDFYLNINKLVFSRKFNRKFIVNVYLVVVFNGLRRLFRCEFKKALNIFSFLICGKNTHGK